MFIPISSLVPQLSVTMPQARSWISPAPATSSPQGCILFAVTSLSLYTRSLLIFSVSVTGSTADSWHTSRWHLDAETSQLASKLSAHSAEFSLGSTSPERSASLHIGHSSVLLYYKKHCLPIFTSNVKEVIYGL